MTEFVVSQDARREPFSVARRLRFDAVVAFLGPLVAVAALVATNAGS